MIKKIFIALLVSQAGFAFATNDRPTREDACVKAEQEELGRGLLAHRQRDDQLIEALNQLCNTSDDDVFFLTMVLQRAYKNDGFNGYMDAINNEAFSSFSYLINYRDISPADNYYGPNYVKGVILESHIEINGGVKPAMQEELDRGRQEVINNLGLSSEDFMNE